MDGKSQIMAIFDDIAAAHGLGPEIDRVALIHEARAMRLMYELRAMPPKRTVVYVGEPFNFYPLQEVQRCSPPLATS